MLMVYRRANRQKEQKEESAGPEVLTAAVLSARVQMCEHVASVVWAVYIPADC